MNTNQKYPEHVMLCIVTILAVGTLLTGCKSADIGESNPLQSQPDSRVALMPGDQIDVKFFYTPELNDLQRIRPDGKITLQLVGDVNAAGVTPAQLQDELKKKYTGLIEKPSVVVIARELAHRNIYIAGSVLLPGLQEMPGHTTVLASIMKAGGFDMTTADIKKVIVIRHQNGERKSYNLDFKGVLSGESEHDPFYLHAQDIVYVPRTGIVRTAQWLDQYITQMIPKTGFSLFYNTGTGDSTIGVDTTSKY